MSVTLSQTSFAAILRLGDDENRFTEEWLDEVESALDEVVRDPSRVLITVGEGRFYSNGLDVTLLGESEVHDGYAARVQRLLARVLTLPVPTIAAVNGHAFGAGAMFALAHDFRIMNAEKGFWCFPEVTIGIPFTAGMASLIQSKISPAAAVESMTTGRRYNAADACDRGLVDSTAAPTELIDSALELAQTLGSTNAVTLGEIKRVMFREAVAALHE